MHLAAIVLLFISAAVAPPEASRSGLPLSGAKAVDFLRSAEISGPVEEFDDLAITDPVRVTLTHDSLVLRAIFKDVDTYRNKFTFGDGRSMTGVRDSWKHEVAAYELDAMLGLGIVPPCVEREVYGHVGSLCMWVENVMTESERMNQRLSPPNEREWNDQMFLIRIFHQLIWDLDYNNVRNLLVDESFKIYKVDSSMAFRPVGELRKEESLTRFPREVLQSLETLQRAEVDERLGAWLDKRQLDALWKRRTRILELAHERVHSAGEAIVLY